MTIRDPQYELYWILGSSGSEKAQHSQNLRWSILSHQVLLYQFLSSLLLSSYSALAACRVQFLLSEPCQLKRLSKYLEGKWQVALSLWAKTTPPNSLPTPIPLFRLYIIESPVASTSLFKSKRGTVFGISLTLNSFPLYQLVAQVCAMSSCWQETMEQSPILEIVSASASHIDIF